MKKSSSLICLLVFWLLGYGDLVINEVFYDAVGSDDNQEWIELYNNSNNDINLDGWNLQAGGTSYSDIYIFPSIMIRANSFFLISETSYPLSNLIITLGFENGGTATDGIRILNPVTGYTDTILYDFPNSNNLEGDGGDQEPCSGSNPGFSIARFSDGEDTDSADDWIPCSTPTPGASNDIVKIVTMKDCQAAISGKTIEVFTLILNLSTYTVDKSELSIKILFNNELKYFEEIDAIAQQDSLSLSMTFNNEFHEEGVLSVELINNTNIDIVDNLWESAISYQVPRLTLSEIMFSPHAGQYEWVEVKLLSNVDQAEITILDALEHQANASISGLEGNYLVIAENRDNLILNYSECDSTKVFQADNWPPLNNTGDSVVLKYYKSLLDSLVYENEAVPRGYSWELNESTNDWNRSNSPNGATPTSINSQYQDNPASDISGLKIINSLISIKLNKQFHVKFKSTKLVSSLNIKIFDIRGKSLHTITSKYANQYQGEYSWDGCLQGKYLTSGLYPIIVRINAANGRLIAEKKAVITINR